MQALTKLEQTALQISKAGSSIATAEQLAEYRLAKNPDGSFVHKRYREGSQAQRISWLSEQFFGLSIILHTTLTASSVAIDVTTLDEQIMDSSTFRDLTILEMQEAFKKGVFKEYGDYYGLTAITMFGFLKGYVRSEKKQTASSIIYKDMAKKEQEANENFFRELFQAQKDGLIKIPDFSHMRVNGPQQKKTYTEEESAAHRAKVRQQAAEILKQANKEDNGKH